MTIIELLQYGTQKLKENAEVASPRLECELLLEKVLQRKRLEFYIYPNTVLEPEQIQAFNALTARRKAGEPIQYILGVWEFMKLSLAVSPRALIPRQDTEILVEAVLLQMPREEPIRLLDLCTGSGCIAVALSYYLKNAHVTACDIDSEAIALAKKNAALQGVEGRMSFVTADIFSDEWLLRSKRLYHALCANPPYIRSQEIDLLERQIKDYEPLRALNGGESGLIFYERIADIAAPLLEPNGLVALEIGYDQADAVTALLKSKGFCSIQVIKDLAEKDRVVTAKKRA